MAKLFCGDCLYYEEDGGWCRRYAPSPRQWVDLAREERDLREINKNDLGYNTAAWPSVAAEEDWCGEFKPSTETEAVGAAEHDLIRDQVTRDPYWMINNDGSIIFMPSDDVFDDIIARKDLKDIVAAYIDDMMVGDHVLPEDAPDLRHLAELLTACAAALDEAAARQ